MPSKEKCEYFRGWNDCICKDCDVLEELSLKGKRNLIKRQSSKCKKCANYQFLSVWGMDECLI